ncbi:MAG: AMP-binding protein [Woeseiaceae bacterium]|nr:AMP-binding protein [Woeseiaceae bacterium]
MPEEVSTPQFKSVLDIFDQAFEKYPANAAYTNMGTTLSYTELDHLSMQFASYLQNTLGLTRGERVAIMLPNILQYPVVMCGIFRAGLVVVNVNPLYTARELEHQLKDSGTKCVIILENFAHTLARVITKTDVSHVVTTGVGDLLNWPKSVLINFVLRYIKRSVPSYKFERSVTFRQALKLGDGVALNMVDIGYADIAYLQYTGGTTGVSKGAMLSHRNMIYNVQQTVTWQADAYKGVEPVVAITALPLYHIFALEGNCLTVMAQGGENVLITNPRDFEGFAKEIAKFDFNLFTGVNTMFAALMDTPSFSDINFSHLRVCIGGGMAVQSTIAKEWKQKTGTPILQAYGLTETSPAAVISPMESEFTGTIGLPIPSTEIMIADDDGNPLPTGDAGEICIRGPQVMEGYWQRPIETAEAISPDGWFRSGDIGYFDGNGYIYIEDRKKDMILVSGFNVYPNEIENVVVELDGVLEAAAIGLPDERSGEIVKLFVVRKSESISEQDIIDHCKANLTGYKRPRIVEFRNDLPKTNVGKILRRELRD